MKYYVGNQKSDFGISEKFAERVTLCTGRVLKRFEKLFEPITLKKMMISMHEWD